MLASFLAPLRDPSLVLPTIAHTLSIREQPGQTALEALASRLEAKRTLLLVDNLEHLLTSATQLSELVEMCPRLMLVVTSRERLNVPGELDYVLPPEVLESLVDKSLLRRSVTELGARFWMLETVREFAYEMLVASGEVNDVLARHKGNFLRVADGLAQARYGTGTAELYASFEADRANFQSALSLAIGEGDASTALRFMWCLGDY